MRTALHVLAKDLRRYWPFVSAFAALLLFQTAAPLWGIQLTFPNLPVGNSVIALGQWPLAFLLAVAVMQEDVTVGDHAFWRTRPIGPGALLTGKLLFFALTISVPLLLANIAIASILHAPGAITAGIAVETIGLTLLGILLAALIGSVTRTVIQAALTCLAMLLVMLLLANLPLQVLRSARVHLPWDTDIPFPGPRVAFACVLMSAVLVAAIAHQLYRRRTVHTFILLGVGIPIVIAVSSRWNVSVAQRPLSRIALFPAQPLRPAAEFSFALEMPARVNGTRWIYDHATQRNRPEQFVIAYAEVPVPATGRSFDLLQSVSTLDLADGEHLTFTPGGQYGWAWNEDARDRALCRAIGLNMAPYRGPETVQRPIGLFTLPADQLRALGGKRGRLTVVLTIGETAYRTQFHLPSRVGAVYAEPGIRWRIDKITQRGSLPPTVELGLLRATTMLTTDSTFRPELDPHRASAVLDRVLLVNRARGEYAIGTARYERAQPGIITAYTDTITFNRPQRADGGGPDTFDHGWLAGAELYALSAENIGRTEKTIVVDRFVVPESTDAPN